MTTFYWNDTEAESITDAAEKGYADGTWLWIDEAVKLEGVNVLDYLAIYFKTGVRELEQAFAKIQRRYSPWLC